MKLKTGEMFFAPTDVLLVSTNAVVERGEVAMTAGAAAQAEDTFPGCSRVFAAVLEERGCSMPPWPVLPKRLPLPYGIAIHPTQTDPILGIFQVKYHWSSRARTDLIRIATRELKKLAETTWAGKSIAMNFPGIGFGMLQRKDVLPIISLLPDNVTVWEFDRSDIADPGGV